MELQNSKLRFQETDKLSNLPWAILDHILCFLPIKDAVRTSVLSRRWRYKWINLSKLVFDRNCVGNWCDINIDAEHFAKLVYHVLLSHSGQIKMFQLWTSSSLKLCDSDIVSWICSFAKKGTRDFIKKITLLPFAEHGHKYKVPPCLFSCQQLTHLHTDCILFELPHNSIGFRNLVSLVLQNFATNIFDHSIDAEVFAGFIRHCPVLETLDLKGFKMPSRLVIHAPKLKELCLWGKFQVISLENCTLLEEVTLYKDSRFLSDNHQGKEIYCNLFQNPSLLSCLKTLVISGYLLEHLHVGNIPEALFSTPNQLKILGLHEITLGDLSQVTIVLAVLKLFPKVQELYISAESDDYADELSEILDAFQLFSCFCFNELQVFKMETSSIDDGGMSKTYWDPELALVKHVLGCSPMLQKMTVEFDMRAASYEKMFMRELLSFEQASKQVKISFYKV